MRLGNLLVEAKLTEGDFQQAPKTVVSTYRDFSQVFNCEDLPQTQNDYLSYQLIRNILAAQASHCSFCLLMDARRSDLIEAWYAVIRCVSPVDLRLRCKILTWQDVARMLPKRLRGFLAEKYGIEINERLGMANVPLVTLSCPRTVFQRSRPELRAMWTKRRDAKRKSVSPWYERSSRKR